MREKLNLYTHDGQFHADEVFATAMFSLIAEEIHVVRGPDTEVPEGSDWIVYDIGGGPLDHHTPENKETNGCHPGTEVPYAACGLVWREYGEEVLRELDCPERYLSKVMRRVESSLIIGIDAEDNEFHPVLHKAQQIPQLSEEQRKELARESRTSMTVSQMIKDFNPTWNSSMDPYECFMDAVSFAKDVLINRIDNAISSADAYDFVMRAIDYSAGHILIMDRFAPWEGIVYGQKSNPKANDIWYAIYPALRGGWNLQCARAGSENRTEYRHPLPASWYGLRNEELAEVTGVPGSLFCHVSGFLAGAETQEAVLELARIACANENARQ
ncbi:MAG: MYG1 family protein [Solobacterium sp.]|nr:MYG1 family protein [Solobacterium sp.]